MGEEWKSQTLAEQHAAARASLTPADLAAEKEQQVAAVLEQLAQWPNAKRLLSQALSERDSLRGEVAALKARLLELERPDAEAK